MEFAFQVLKDWGHGDTHRGGNVWAEPQKMSGIMTTASEIRRPRRSLSR